MALRVVSRSSDEAAALIRRFNTAQDGAPSEEQLHAQANIRAEIASAADEIDHLIEDGREKSIALTHLEDALMWAGKAIFKTAPKSQIVSRNEGEVLP